MNNRAVRGLIEGARAEGRDLLLSEALELLEHYGIPTVRGLLHPTVEEALQAAEQIGYPVAIKIISEQISHKSDVGGVQLNLRNAAQLWRLPSRTCWAHPEAYPEAKLDGVLVQPMVTGGRELILGGRQDPQFGPVVLVGLGGIFVEIFDEVVMRVAPITRQEAEEMIESLRGVQILKGARGEEPCRSRSPDRCPAAPFPTAGRFSCHPGAGHQPAAVFHQAEGCRALDARHHSI